MIISSEIRKIIDDFRLSRTCTQQSMLHRKRRRRRVPVKLPELPFDCIVEILSWLPVQSLLKFKCMCKQWCSQIQEYEFVTKHMDRSTPMLLIYPCKSDDGNFEFVSSSAGLCLEKSIGNSGVYRIRNPSTHQVFHLPDAPPYATTLDFAFNSDTAECKVLCVYFEKTRKNVDAKFGFQIFTVGTDEGWRPLELPDNNKLRNKFVLYGSNTGIQVDGVFHLLQIIRLTDEEYLYVEVQSFDLWNESFTTNAVPRGVLSDGVLSDSSRVYVDCWNNCLTVDSRTDSTLDALVLEDYKEHRWCKNRVIIPFKLPDEVCAQLKHVNPYHKLMTTAFDLHVSGVNYNITYVGKPERTTAGCTLQTGEIFHKPSLMTLKGMVPEKDCNGHD